ncbi:hypothetical protein MtrunA17_Chr4g0060991 [Medicago truncatula]|uniref:Uncharacterized protein n=1 Tax=Medicago truncatula TaxID=3880 RepID=A0A072V1G9_MEDTR|nr:hypothetical protein MTR_4g108850 [Medicago truncatula]RHN63684.1 hypothetical protein MtrunA17_Chr4g0060991 [Medicago truncatula]
MKNQIPYLFLNGKQPDSEARKKHQNFEDYVMLYTTICNMCTQKAPNDYSQIAEFILFII